MGTHKQTQFYKEHIKDTLDFLKRVYTPEACDKLEADRLDDLINRDGCANNKWRNLRLTCGPCNSRKGAKVYTDALPF